MNPSNTFSIISQSTNFMMDNEEESWTRNLQLHDVHCWQKFCSSFSCDILKGHWTTWKNIFNSLSDLISSLTREYVIEFKEMSSKWDFIQLIITTTKNIKNSLAMAYSPLSWKKTYYRRSIFVVIVPFVTIILSLTMLSPKNMIYTTKKLKFYYKNIFH
jgi:hypothetical protein